MFDLDDGPCAYPQSDTIEESIADPLATLGFMLISLSFILASIFFTIDDQGNNRQVATMSALVDLIFYPPTCTGENDLRGTHYIFSMRC